MGQGEAPCPFFWGRLFYLQVGGMLGDSGPVPAVPSLGQAGFCPRKGSIIKFLPVCV
jgi:hypothetical protein